MLLLQTTVSRKPPECRGDRCPLKELDMDELEERVIRISKSKTLLIVLITAGFVAFGVWLLTQDADTIRSWRKFNSPGLVYGVGIVSVGFFGMSGIFAIRKLVDTSPGLIINRDGITDNSSGVSVGFIPWSDVVKIGEYSRHGQKWFLVHVKDPDIYINRASLFPRISMRINRRLYGTPVCVWSNGLSIDYYQLHRLIFDFFNKARSK